MKKSIYILMVLMSTTVLLNGQAPAPAPAQSNPILLKGGTAHLGNGTVINNSLIAFDKGKITTVRSADQPMNESGHIIIDVQGKHIYPGFILPASQIGLEEVSAVRAMSDSRERGELNPNIRSIISYNTDSEYIPTMRYNGVLVAESTPRGGIISGTSSLMEMEGWNWEDAAHTVDIGLHMNWPRRKNRRFDFATFTASYVENKNYPKEIANLKDFFAEAKAYGEEPAKETNLKLEAMLGLFDGKKILNLHCGTSKEIIEGIRFAQSMGVQKIVLHAGTEALHIADFLAENNIPVILPATQSVPSRSDMAIDLPYALPHLLTQKGVTVSISNSGESLGSARNLGFYAGTAIAYGMDKEEALKTITSNTAKALGVDQSLGTLEVGKDASLFVSEGDALDYKGNILNYVFIKGKMVDLPNKQQKLFERFSNKYGH